MNAKIYEGHNDAVLFTAAMKKTLFIGLGGSGKEVLMRLRRKFFSTSENKYGYDFIRYLWIDTDVDGPGICDENWAVIGEGISFSARDGINEVFDASIDGNTLSSFYDRINTYPHIRHWFPTDALKPLGFEALKNGAKGIRPLGRLAFAWHSANILQAVRDNIGKLDVKFKVEGVDLDDSLAIYIVGSLAGGTGSGMFLELAKMIKAYWPAYPVIGVFFMSDMFSSVGDNQYRDANCYAALQELDFYQNASNKLDPLISRERSMFQFVTAADEHRDFNLPLYSNVFLVTNEYFKAPRENLFSDPFEMVSEIFYYDFDHSEFGAQKRSRTVNSSICGSQASVEYLMPDPENGQDVSVSSTYPSDYSAFSLAGIFLNITKMKNWGAYKYIVDLLSNLLKSNPANPDLYVNTDGTFRIRKLNFDDLMRGISHGNAANSLMSSYIDGMRSRKQAKLDDILSRIRFDHTSVDRVQSLCQQQLEELDRFIQDEQGHAERELIVHDRISGATLEKLQANLQSQLLEMYQEIEALMYKILADYETGGISVANQMLNQVKSKLGQMDVNYNSYVNETRRAKEKMTDVEMPKHPEIKIDARLFSLLHKIQDCDEIPVFFPGYKTQAKKYYDRILSGEIGGMNREIKRQITEYSNSCLEIVEKRFSVAFQEKVGALFTKLRAGIIELIDSMDVNLSVEPAAPGMNRQIRQYQSILSTLQGYFEQYEVSLRTEIDNNLNRKMVLDDNLDKDNLYTGFLRTLNGDDWFTSQIANHYLPLVNQVHGINSQLTDNMQQFVKVLTFYDRIGTDADIEIKPMLKGVCRAKFNQWLQDESVLDALNNAVRSDQAKYKNLVGNMLGNFNFRLALSQAYPIIQSRVETTSMVRIVGLPEQNHEVEKFLQELGTVDNFTYHGSPENILFYSETFGYPLFMLKNIGDLRNALTHNIERGDNNKHHRYTDIVTDYLRPLVVPQSNQDMINILHSWEVLYEAIVLRVIKFEDKTWRALIKNPERFNIEEDITFGRTLESAINKLNGNSRLLEIIRRIVNNRFAEQFNGEEQISQIFFALYANYEDVVHYVNDQFKDDSKPKIPQEYVLHKLIKKYIGKYSQLKDGISIEEAQDQLLSAYVEVMKINSGYKDSVHSTGLKIYPEQK